MKTHKALYQIYIENGVQLKEVTCNNKGVFVETLTITFEKNGNLKHTYTSEKII